MNQEEPILSPALERLASRLSDRQLAIVGRAYDAIADVLLSMHTATARIRELGASRSNEPRTA